MKPPLQKASQKNKPPATSDGCDQTVDPRVIFLRKLYGWMNTRLGWPIAAVILLLGAMWANWSHIAEWPGVEAALTKLHELKDVPQASGDRFAIVIPTIENDKDGAHRRLISDGLRGQFDKDEVEVLLVERSITIEGNEKPQEAVKAGHERARSLLRQANANVMIWGQVLDAKVGAPVRLHWTLDANAILAKSSDRYRLSGENYDFPELFWTDLKDVLSLLVAGQASTFSAQRGTYVADRLTPFVSQVRQLISGGTLTGIQKSSMQLVLADELATLGEQIGKRQTLDEAVRTYREVLKEYNPQQAPLEWALIHNNLGNALVRLGEQSGERHVLEAAESAYREALTWRKRGSVPLLWASTMNNLGGALLNLSEREDEMGRLKEAADAYRAASEVFNRERDKLDWAMTQSNLGNALVRLGERENSAALLTEAVKLHREALKERSQLRVPLLWATTQINLGNALWALGNQLGSQESLEEAVSAYHRALEEFSQTQVPLLWAATLNNLGNALSKLGEYDEGTERLDAAEKAYRKALTVRTKERARLEWAKTQRNLGNVVQLLGMREKGTARLDEAVKIYLEVLTVIGLEQEPNEWKQIQLGLKRTKEALQLKKNL